MGPNRNRVGLSTFRRDEREEMIAAPPMDLSFKKAITMDELENERARSNRTGKIPARTSSHHYLTSSLWLNNNSLTSMARLENLVNKLINDPTNLAWLDLSFNNISDIHDEITKFPQLKIIYLHGNNISNISSIVKLRTLRNLRSLSLHGNPIESIPFYRGYVVSALPQLRNLDFASIIAIEREKAPPADFAKIMRN